MKIRHAVVAVMGLCLVQWAHAQVNVSQAWVRATAPGQTTAAVYMQIESKEPAVLVSAASPVAKMAEAHETSVENGVTKMRAVERLALPAGKTVELKPGGYHIMLMGLAKPLRPGDKVPITLMLETPDRKHRNVTVRAQVRELASPGEEHMRMR
jgi:periplasmic copper chaperone A